MTIIRLQSILAVILFSLSITAGCDSGASDDARKAFPDPQGARVAEAILNNDGAKVTKLIQKGANVNSVDGKGRSLIEYAIWKNKHSAFEALLSAGANARHADEDGETPLHYAASSENPVYMTELLAKHLDVNVVTKSNRTPLMFTALFDHGPQMQELIAAGANLEVAQSNGDTALIMASESNAFDGVLDLLHAGANPRAGHKIQGRPDTTFWFFVDMTPEKVLSADGKRKKAEMRSWLEAHNVSVDSLLPQK